MNGWFIIKDWMCIIKDLSWARFTWERGQTSGREGERGCLVT